MAPRQLIDSGYDRGGLTKEKANDQRRLLAVSLAVHVLSCNVLLRINLKLMSPGCFNAQIYVCKSSFFTMYNHLWGAKRCKYFSPVDSQFGPTNEC